MLYIIAGRYKNRKLASPKGQETRPTTSRLRETLFNICQNYVENAQFLDLFCGSGAIGFEALSRGAAQVTFIDGSRESMRCVQENMKILEAERVCYPLLGEAILSLNRLNKQKKSFDIIYMDPPYGVEGLTEKILEEIDKTSLLNPGGMLFVEESKSILIDKERWLTLKLKSARQMGRSQLIQFEKADLLYEK